MVSLGAETASTVILNECLTSNSPVQNSARSLAHEERQKLLIENLAEVRHIARRIHARLPRHIPFDDLVHEGVVGLIDAVKKYDPTRSVQLRSYARNRIRGAILDSLRKSDWGSRHLRRQARRIEQTTSELTGRFGRAPSQSEVAAGLRVPLGEFQRVLKELHWLSAEASPAPPELFSREEVFGVRPSSAGEDPFETCLRMETAKVLMEASEMLAEKERQALTLYYFEERTMKEIGRILHVQESRISQIITAAQSRLRVQLQESLLG